MERTVISDWPTPTVSIQTLLKPAASQTSMVSRVRPATPPSEPREGEGRMKAFGSIDKLFHARFVAEDAAASDRTGGIDAQHGEFFSAIAKNVHAHFVEERAFANSGDTGDADAAGLSRVWEKRIENFRRKVRCRTGRSLSITVMVRARVVRSPASTPETYCSAAKRRVRNAYPCNACRTSCAESGIRVPGPKTPPAPASSKCLEILGRNHAAHDNQNIRTAQSLQFRESLPGTSVMCPPASVETPSTCTSFSTAMRATSSGVWKSGPRSTSNPKSAKAVAITFAPRSWPSCPIFATRMRGRRPFGFGKGLHQVARFDELRILPAFRGVHTGNRVMHRLVAAKNFFEGGGNFAEGGALARGIDGEFQKIAFAGAGAIRKRGQRRFYSLTLRAAFTFRRRAN